MSINPEYIARQHHIVPSMLLHPDLDCHIKTYELFPVGTPVNPILITDSLDMIAEKFLSGSVSRRSGVGFAIISDDLININIWGSETPSLIHQTPYTSRERSNGHFVFQRQQDISQLGSYCIWESKILAHEAGAWLEYLRSPKTPADLTSYLDKKLSDIL